MKKETWRDRFARADNYIKDLTLKINEGEILIEQFRRFKSEEWNRHFNNGGKEVEQVDEKRAGKKKHSH